MIRALVILAAILLASFGGGARTAGELNGQALPPVHLVLPPLQPPITPTVGNPSVVYAVDGVAYVPILAALSGYGHPTFVYGGGFGVAPIVRVYPGDTMEFYYLNLLPPPTSTSMNMTNLHFHGLRVSPLFGSDDVLTMLAAPGGSLNYSVYIPTNHEPGLYWYHTHAHGEVNPQTGDGAMSGAIVIEGLQTHIPVLASMRERIIVIRAPLKAGAIDPDAVRRSRLMQLRSAALGPLPVTGSNCNGPDVAHELTVNNMVNPAIGINAGEPEFFRVVNATGQRTLNVSIGNRPLTIVALDGVALDAFPGSPTTITVNHIIIPPAGRAEFVVYGTAQPIQMTTSCYFSGPVGDPDPPAILATLLPDGVTSSAAVTGLQPRDFARMRVNPLPQNVLSSPLPPPAQVRTTVFSENASGTQFFIDGQQFNPAAPPHFIVKVGTVEEWNVINATHEIHDFHIHQVHFIVEAINGIPQPPPYFWYDTYIIPFGNTMPNGTFVPGSLKLLLDFRDPVIKGEFVYHCHLLDHEDKGMMAKISAE